MHIDKTYLQKLEIYDEFIKSEINIELIQSIANDFSENRTSYEEKSKDLARYISTFERVHLTHSRVKTLDGLIKKIIRKSLDGRTISLENYKMEITDLIGVRALHVFKSDYLPVHAQIMKNFKSMLRENVHVNLRPGDSIDIYSGIHDPHPHRDSDYRSIHYIITPDGDNGPRAEIQVRTLFEEGWSEINHQLLYNVKPTEMNVLLRHASSILSALAGDCDTLGELMNKISQYHELGKGTIIETSPSSTDLPDTKILASEGKSLVDIMEEFLNGK